MASHSSARTGSAGWPTATSPPSSRSTSRSPRRTSSVEPRRLRRARGPLAVVGRDTRISGQFLEAAVVAGLASAGVDVLLLGVLPTPGVAYLTDALGADLGVMLSASPQPDARQRHQVPRPRRRQARRRHRGRDRGARSREPWDRPTGGDVGRVTPLRRGRSRSTPPTSSRTARPPARPGSRSSSTAPTAPPPRSGPRALRDAGADGDRDLRRARRPQHQRRLRLDPPRRRCSEAVLEHGADVGFALDGDADRCLAVDHDGRRRRRRPDPGDPRARAARAPAGWPTTPSWPP